MSKLKTTFSQSRPYHIFTFISFCLNLKLSQDFYDLNSFKKFISETIVNKL